MLAGRERANRRMHLVQERQVVLRFEMAPDILQEHCEVVRAHIGADEPEALVEPDGIVVLRVDQNGPRPDDAGGINRASEGVVEKVAAHALSLHGRIDGQSGDQSDGNRMAGEALTYPTGSLFPCDGSIRDGVDANDAARTGSHVDAGLARGMGRVGEPPYPVVELWASTGERFVVVVGLKESGVQGSRPSGRLDERTSRTAATLAGAASSLAANSS